jgi:AraC-like DNA-binding protein
MKLFIKNMVCDRCIMVVKNELDKLGLNPLTIKLGEVELPHRELTNTELSLLDEKLVSLGFERIDDRKSRLIEAIKTLIINDIQKELPLLKINWSVYIADKLHYEYNYLSTLFSSVEGVTIEHFIIKQKIEKVKELLIYDELNLNEIAWKLGYSSVSHLSSQFKKVTGMSPAYFRKMRIKDRNPLDKL